MRHRHMVVIHDRLRGIVEGREYFCVGAATLQRLEGGKGKRSSEGSGKDKIRSVSGAATLQCVIGAVSQLYDDKSMLFEIFCGC